MTEQLGWAELQIRPTFGPQFDHELQQGPAGALIAAGRSGGAKYGDSAGRSMASRFSSHVKTAALAGSAALATAGYALFKIGKESIAEARESQKVGALTAQVIKTTGGAANVTAKQVGDLSTALSLKTGVDDEVIQRGANMILTFKDIRNEVGANNDIFNQSVAITEDMAAAMAGGQGGNGLDLKSASILVGKALNDPAKGLTALTRVGVSFTEQQKKQIGAMVDAGNTMGAQKLILHELQSEFGGAAAAQATLGEKVSVAWGNIEEQLGTALLPMVEKAERVFLKKGVPAIEGWVDAFQKKGVPALKDFYRKAKPVAEDVLPAVGDALKTVRDFAAEAAPHIADMAQAFHDMPDWAKKAIVGGGLAAGVGAKLGLTSLLPTSKGGGGSLVGSLIGSTKPVPVIVMNKGFDAPDGSPTTNPSKLTKYGPALAETSVLALAAAGSYYGVTHLAAPNIKQAGLDMAPGAAAFNGASAGGTPQAVTDATKAADAAAAKMDAAFQSNGNYAGKMLAVYEKFGPVLNDSVNGITALQHADQAFMTKFGMTIAQFSKFPKKLQTEMTLKGVPESAQEALRLSRKYDLAAKDRQTLFKTAGISQAQVEVAQYARKISTVPKWITSSIQLTGVEAAQQQIASLIASIHAIPSIGSHDVPYVHGGTSGGSGGSSRPATPRGRGATINIHLDGKQVGSVVDDRIGTYDDLAQEHRRAGGSR